MADRPLAAPARALFVSATSSMHEKDGCRRTDSSIRHLRPLLQRGGPAARLARPGRPRIDCLAGHPRAVQPVGLGVTAVGQQMEGALILQSVVRGGLSLGAWSAKPTMRPSRW